MRNKMGLSPEDHLLILCARTYFEAEDLATISVLIKQNLDWNYLISVSIQHSVALLLHHGLSIVTDDSNRGNQKSFCVPDPIKAELQSLYQNNRHRTTRLHLAMAEIFEAFERRNIAVMALKELGLMQFAYPDPNLRPIGDLDLMIRKHDFAEAAQCLESLGFRPLPAADCYFRLTYDAEYQFQRSADNVWVDLQWDIENKEMDVYGDGSLNFEVDRMWQNARPIQIAGCDVLIPSPVDMLFHLCLHLEGHGYSELVLLTDIAEAIRVYRDDLVWDDLIALAKKYGVQATVYYVLRWVNSLFSPPIPAHVFEALTPPYFKAHLFEALFGNLISQHGYLDEIALVATPPAGVLSKFESIARRQAVGAMRLYQVIDKTLLDFKTAGGQIIILKGKASSVVFPNTVLPVFNPLQLLIFVDDLPLLMTTLQHNGFKAQASSLRSNLVVQSKDKALAGSPFNLGIRWQVETDKQKLANPQWPVSFSKREVAVRIVKDTLRGAGKDNLDIEVNIEVYPLKPEELLADLCLKTGDEDSKLLAGCDILEFFRVYAANKSIDWANFVDAVSSQFDQSIFSSLVVACQAAGAAGQAEIEQGLNRLRVTFPEKNLEANQSRLFTHSRYGAGLSNKYDALIKNAFFVVLTFLSIQNPRAKLVYLWRLLTSATGGKRGLVRMGRFIISFIVLASGAVYSKEKKQYRPKDWVYWTE